MSPPHNASFYRDKSVSCCAIALELEDGAKELSEDFYFNRGVNLDDALSDLLLPEGLGRMAPPPKDHKVSKD